MISGKNFLQISKKFILVLALLLFLVRIFCKSVVASWREIASAYYRGSVW